MTARAGNLFVRVADELTVVLNDERVMNVARLVVHHLNLHRTVGQFNESDHGFTALAVTLVTPNHSAVRQAIGFIIKGAKLPCRLNAERSLCVVDSVPKVVVGHMVVTIEN